MTGCFGNDPEDRARARELDRYLDKTYGEIDEDAEELKMAEREYYEDLKRKAREERE